MIFLTEPVTKDNWHIALTEATKIAAQAASLVYSNFAFEPNLDAGLTRNANSFINTGSDNDLALVILYLAKLQSKREEALVAAEEAVIHQQREDKMREDAEEDRFQMFLHKNHSYEALR